IESLLGEHLLDLRGQSPPPTKDFFQLVITKTEVFKNWTPQTLICLSSSLEQVGAVFAQRILEHTILLCQGKSDYLERKPDVTSLKILSYTQLEGSYLPAVCKTGFTKVQTVQCCLYQTTQVWCVTLYNSFSLWHVCWCFYVFVHCTPIHLNFVLNVGLYQLCNSETFWSSLRGIGVLSLPLTWRA
uniref:Uncharacterized protein n=1 Tax=Sparus aurata TaxID=8175 RepID=A0A671XL37_SPAAU